MGGDGNESRPLMAFVGDFPSERDDGSGLPFQSKAGTLLRDTLDTLEVPADSVYMTNAVRCHPPDNKAGARVIKACAHIIKEELEMVRPKVIVVLGAVALESLTDRKGILASRGQVFDYTFADGTVVPLIAANHPSFVLYQESALDQFVGDLQKAHQIATMGRAVAKPSEKRYRIARTVSDLYEMLREMRQEGMVAWDIETRRKEPFLEGAKVVCVQFSASPDTGWLVPVDHAESDSLEATREQRIEAIRGVIERMGGPDLCGQNLKFDMNFVEECLGIHPRLPVFDTMIAHHMLFEEESKAGGNGLKVMAWKFTDMGGYERAVEEADPEFYEHMDTIPLETLLSYACGDTDCTLQIWAKLRPMIVEQNLEEVLRLEIEKQDFLKQMEKRGAAIDWDYRNHLMEALPAKSARLRDRLRQESPVDLIIDDGSHALADQVAGVRALWCSLRVRGVYVVEDLQDERAVEWFRREGWTVEDYRGIAGRYDDLIAWRVKLDSE
jgi:uracil-DNA glycosylase family 4